MMEPTRAPETHSLQRRGDDVSILDVLHVLAKRKRCLITIVLAAAVLAAAWSYARPNIYTATARVLPPQKESGGAGLSALLGQVGALSGLAGGLSGLSGPGELYVGILKSRSVADAVIKRLDLVTYFKAKDNDEARSRLAKSIKPQLGKDGIIVIAANSRDPKQAAAIANAMVEELGKRSVQLNLTKAGIERSFLEKRIDLVRDNLRQAEENLRTFAEKNKAIRVEAQASATIAEIARIRAELVAKEVQLATLRSYQTEESPEVKLLKNAITKLQSQLRAEEGAGDTSSIPTVGRVPSLGLEYTRLVRAVKVQEAILEQLTKQFEAAKLMEAKDSSSLQVLDDAVPPVRKSKPKRVLIVLIATFTAAIFGTIVVFLQEYLERMPSEDRSRWGEIKRSLQWRKKVSA